MKLKNLLPLIIFVILVVFLYISLGIDNKKLPSPLINKPFPSLEVVDFYDNTNKNTLDYIKNKLVLVNVWASWCAACKDEHNELLKISKNNNVYMLGVNYKDNLLDAKNFLAKLGNPFDAIIFDKNGKMGLELGVYAIPETFIVDSSGTIRYKKIAAITSQILANEINPLINKLNNLVN